MHWIIAKEIVERYKDRNLAFLSLFGDAIAYEFAKIAKGWIVDGYKFKYRRKITITERSGSNLTDYQIRIDLSSENFDFSRFLNNGNDLRFTDANGNLLSYWIEKMDIANEQAIIWVKVPSIPANTSVEIYMYYGNSEAPTKSNGEATFDFFDDFTSGGFEVVWDSGVLGTGSENDVARNILIDGNILYAVSRVPNLVVYDITDPANPVLLANVSLPYSSIDVRKKDNYLFISCSVGVMVYDVSDPSNPTQVTLVDLGAWVHGMYLDGNFLYCCMHTANKFQILDVSDPTNPVLRGNLSGSTYFHGCHDCWVEDGYAYVANYAPEAGEYGFVVVDVSNPDSPTVVGYTAEGLELSAVWKVGNYCYVGSHSPNGGLYVFNVTDPTSPMQISVLLEGAENFGYWLDQYDATTLAAICSASDKLFLVDISDPSKLKIKASIYFGYNPKSVEISGDYFYVSLEDWATYEWRIAGCKLVTPLQTINTTKWEIIEFEGGLVEQSSGCCKLHNDGGFNGAGIVALNPLPAGDYVIEARIKRETGYKTGEIGYLVGFTDKTSQDTTYYGVYGRRAVGIIYEHSSNNQRLRSEYDDSYTIGDSSVIPEWDAKWLRISVKYLHSLKKTVSIFTYPDGSSYELDSGVGTTQLAELYPYIHYGDRNQGGWTGYCDFIAVRKFTEPEPLVEIEAEEVA